MKELNGLINVLKPAGMTSHDVVNKIRRLLKITKVGHTGTLDPGVTGVLPICIGRGTKVAQFMTEKVKEYRGELTLGISTNTQDGSGNVVGEKESSHLTEEQIRAAFANFVGNIKQIPPMVSAVKHKGKRLYELARQGQEVEREPREITIYKLEILETKKIGEPHPAILFDVLCSKGTYIRTLCADIGEALKVGGHMSSLIRTKSGPFDIENAVSLEVIEEYVKDGKLEEILHPLEVGLQGMNRIEIRPNLVEKVQHGNRIFLPGVISSTDGLAEGQTICIYGESKLIALGKVIRDETYQGNEPRHYFQPVTVLI